MEFTKFRLAALVIMSAVLGYLIGSDTVDYLELTLLTLGGAFITGAANGLNQIAEKDVDKLMSRTQNRPLPTGRMTVREAYTVCLAMAGSGAVMLWVGTNWLCAVLSLSAMLMYAYVYTPMKRISPIAVFIGAIPGALPPLLGWVAARGFIGYEALVLFIIQFFWQFPHFWAIAWRSHEDYTKAGFYLLPLKSKDPSKGLSRDNAVIILFYTLMCVIAGLLPYFFGYCGLVSTIIITVAGIYFSYTSTRLLISCSMKDATSVMFASFFYLPVVQLFLYLNL